MEQWTTAVKNPIVIARAAYVLVYLHKKIKVSKTAIFEETDINLAVLHRLFVDLLIKIFYTKVTSGTPKTVPKLDPIKSPEVADYLFALGKWLERIMGQPVGAVADLAQIPTPAFDRALKYIGVEFLDSVASAIATGSPVPESVR